MSKDDGGVALPWESTFVENLTYARRAQNLSQTELAKRLTARGLPYHQMTVHRTETGSRPVRLNEAVVMAEVLGINFADALRPSDPLKLAEVLKRALEVAEMDRLQCRKQLSEVVSKLGEASASLDAEGAGYLRGVQRMATEPEESLVARKRELFCRLDALAQGVERLITEGRVGDGEHPASDV